MNKAEQNARSVKTITGIVLSSITLYSFSYSIITVMINEVVNGFSLSGVSEGMMSSMFSLGSMVALLAAPLIQGRVAKMTVLISATALQALMLMFCGLSPVFVLFCVSCSFLGVGGGLADAYSNSLLVDVHREKSTRYLGYLHGLFGVGSLLAPLLILLGLGLVGWQGVFLMLATVLLIGVAILSMIVKRSHRTDMKQVAREKVVNPADLLEYVKNPRNIAVIATAVCITASQTGVLVWVSRYMALRFEAEAMGAVSISLFWICATINRFTVTRAQLAPARLFAVGAIMGALFLGAGIFSNSALGMCIAMGGVGLCTGHFMPLLFSECTRGFEGRTTFATSVLLVAVGVIRSVMPLVMAFIAAAVSMVASMLLPAFTLVGVAACGLLLARIGRRCGS